MLRPPINYDPWQLEFLAVKGDKILCTGRQVGKSEVCAKDAGDFAINNPNSHPIVMIAPTERQARGLFTKTLNYLADYHPKELITKGKYRPTNTRIVLKNKVNKKKPGVEIYCLPVGKDGLGIRFLTIGRLYKDECSRIPEAVHEAVDPALLTTGGDEILLSTPAGAIGTFHDVFINKDGVYNSFTRFSITSEKVIADRKICESWTQKQRDKALMKLAQAKARWTKRRYSQEYLGTFEEGLFRWFSTELIEECCILKPRENIFPNREYYMGVDIARMGEDEGTIEILDKINDKTIHHVTNIITKKQLTDQTEDRIVSVNDLYNCKRIAIDAGAGTLGVSVLDHLMKIPKIKKILVAINNAKRVIDRSGGKAKLLKSDLYDNMRSMMEHGVLKLLDNDHVRESLASIQYEYIMKDDEPTRLKIHGDYSHIVEGLIRACWMANQKSLNLNIISI